MKLMLKVIAIQFCALLFTTTSNAQTFNGYALYNLQNQNTTYLIDKNGNIAHTWSCSAACNYTVKLKPNGNIVRGTKNSSNQLNGAAVGGKVQELDGSANVVWEYTYSNADHCSHHDLEILPNGNVILIAWEVKTQAELTQAGRTGVTAEMWPTHFIELEQSGSTATIVWEWHIWDHMIQDADGSKDNFGVVENHPELMDINAVSGGGGGPGPGGNSGDWFHANGVGYNEALDQIAFTARYANEVFIIDHSTTTAEAASHSGGNSGQGGDFLYRWGHPANYGSTAAQTVPAAVHDPRWIEDDGRPNAGMLQIFNNEGGSGNSSAIDAITTPASGFMYTYGGSSYAPSTYDWRHDCVVSNDGQGSSKTMSNGNVFVNVSQQYMYEADQNGNVIWQYNASPTKAFRYECDHPGIIALLGADPCGIAAISEETISQVELYPNPSTGVFKVDGFALGENDLNMSVVDMFGKVITEVENTLELDLSDFPDGIYFVKLIFNDEKVITKKITTIR